MSNADVERQLADYFGWLEDEIGGISDLTTGELAAPSGHAALGQGVRGLWWTAVTAASVFALLAGLVLIAGRGAVNDTASTATPVNGTPFGHVDDVAEDEWLYPTALPAGVRYGYPMRTDRSDHGRSLHFVSDADLVGYVVEIQQVEGESSRDGSSPEKATNEESLTIEELGGHRWDVVSDDDVWSATVYLDSTSVRVSGPVAFGDSARSFIEGLVVVGEADLPSRPLDFDGDFIDVARHEGEGRVSTVIGVAESNGYFCIKFRGSIGGGGGCAVALSPDEVLSGVMAAIGAGSAGRPIDVAGIARSDVALVELSLVDGSVVTTTPTDLSGQFDVRFWVASTDVPIGNEDPAASWSTLDDLVTEIRAYDGNGNLLATQLPTAHLPD